MPLFELIRIGTPDHRVLMLHRPELLDLDLAMLAVSLAVSRMVVEQPCASSPLANAAFTDHFGRFGYGFDPFCLKFGLCSPNISRKRRYRL